MNSIVKIKLDASLTKAERTEFLKVGGSKDAMQMTMALGY
jgi:hypothetical protein